MKTIKVLGPGCRRCDLTARIIEKQARILGVDVVVEKVTDMQEIFSYGALHTPGVVVDGEVVHTGGVPDVKTARGWLQEE